MEIDKTYFNFEVYKDQNQFNIKNEASLMARLQDSQKVIDFHENKSSEEPVFEKKMPKPNSDEFYRKVELAYHKRFEKQDCLTLKRLHSLLKRDESVKISGEALALEMMTQCVNGKDVYFPSYVAIGFYFGFVPYFVSLATGQPMFQSLNHKLSFAFMQFPMGVSALPVFKLFNSTSELLNMKKKLNQSLVSFLDNRARNLYDLVLEVPQMITQEPNNITSFIQLQRLCDGLYNPHFKRAQLFTSIVYTLYSLQFLYICF